MKRSEFKNINTFRIEIFASYFAQERYLKMEFECPVCYEKMWCPFIIKCGHTTCYSCLITQLTCVNSPKANCPLGCGYHYHLNDMVPLYAMIPAMNDGKEMTRCVKDLENRRKILQALTDKIDEEGKEFYYDYSD